MATFEVVELYQFEKSYQSEIIATTFRMNFLKKFPEVVIFGRKTRLARKYVC